MKFLVVIVFCFCNQSAKLFVSGQNPPSSISSLDWQYKQIEAKIRNYENRIKGSIPKIQAQINSTIAGMGNDFPAIVAVLNTSYYTLANLATVNSYGSSTIQDITCENMNMKISSIGNDINRLAKISCDAAVNETVVITQQAYIQGVTAQYGYKLNNSRQLALANCTNELSVLADQYLGYVLQLTNAIVVYNVLYAEIVIWKNQYCTNCPTRFTANDTKNLAIIDDDINQIEMALNEIEEYIRSDSEDIISKVNSVNPSFKKDVSMYNLAVSLDSVANLVQGFTQLDTLEFVNETASCDDNNWKIAVVQYKMSLYMEMIVESTINSSLVIVDKAVIQAYYYTDKNVMTSSQNGIVSNIITDLDLLVEYYRQYILSCAVAYTKLYLVLIDLMMIQGSACTCTPGSVTSKIRYSKCLV